MNYPASQQIYTQTENINILGTYVETEQKIPLGTKVDITIEIPVYTNDSSLTGNVRCRGDIFRCNLAKETGKERFYGLGIFFTDFSDEEDRNKLTKYIDFLILKEKEEIKKALKIWRKKRRRWSS